MFTTPLPTLTDFLDAYKAGIRGSKDQRADLIEGSLYEQIGGVSAIIWSRLAQRDENLFEDAQTETADGNALTERVSKIFGVERLLQNPGTGSVILTRPNTAGGGGKFYADTRIELISRAGDCEPLGFVVASDTDVIATATRIEIPIRAVTVGPAVSAVFEDVTYPRLVDTVWDATWTAQALSCSAGSDFEPAPQLRARARLTRKDQRFGQYASILRACKAAGAEHVVLFPSNFGGDDLDHGLNWVYVGDGSFNCNESLRRSCVLALESARVLGDQLQVGPMVQTNLAITADVFLSDSPAKVNGPALVQRLRNYVVAALKQDYTYSLDAFRGAMYQASPLVQDVTFQTPTSDGPLLTLSNGVLNFPTSLARYSVLPDSVTLTLKGS